MHLSEKFTLYEAKNFTQADLWTRITKSTYDVWKKDPSREVRRLAIVPEYTIKAQSIFRANHGGTYHQVQIWQDNKVIYQSGLHHDHWGDIALHWLIQEGRIPPMPEGQLMQSTQFIRDELNIDYDVLEVKRLKDLP